VKPLSRVQQPDEQGFVFRMEEGEGGLPLAGIFWLHGRAKNEHTKTDEIKEADLPVDLLPPPLPDRLTTQEVSEHALVDINALRQLVPEGAPISVLLSALRDNTKELEPISSTHWVHRVFNETYFRARPPSIGKLEREEASFVFEALGLSSGSRVLDAGCGFGRLSIPLSELGAHVLALDISVDMTTKTIAFAKEAKVKLDVREGDFRRCHYETAFDAIVCADTTFGSYSDADNLSTLQAFHDSLKPQGKLYVEVINRDACIRELPGRTWWEGRGCLVQEDSEFVDQTSRVKVKRLVVTAEGGQDEHWVDLRLYSVHELHAMFEMLGFKILEISGSFRTKGAFFATHSKRIAIVAQRID
jgi:SAM-dependent methyltransferase